MLWVSNTTLPFNISLCKIQQHSLSLETCIHSKLTHTKKLSGTFSVLIIKSVRRPSLWRECFWEKLFKTDETYTRAHHPLPPAFQASLTQSAPFSCPQRSIPTYFLTFPVLTTMLLTVWQWQKDWGLDATFKNKIFPWPCCPCRSQLHFPIITQTQTRHFVLTVFTSHIPEALQFNFSKNITPWTHMWTSFRFGDFDTQRMQSSTVAWIQILTSQLISNVIPRYFGDKVLTFHTHSLARKEEIKTWAWNVTV